VRWPSSFHQPLHQLLHQLFHDGFVNSFINCFVNDHARNNHLEHSCKKRAFFPVNKLIFSLSCDVHHARKKTFEIQKKNLQFVVTRVVSARHKGAVRRAL
jgi:hypothetical protein